MDENLGNVQETPVKPTQDASVQAGEQVQSEAAGGSEALLSGQTALSGQSVQGETAAVTEQSAPVYHEVVQPSQQPIQPEGAVYQQSVQPEGAVYQQPVQPEGASYQQPGGSAYDTQYNGGQYNDGQNNGQYNNGQYGDNQYSNGQYSNGQYNNGQYSNSSQNPTDDNSPMSMGDWIVTLLLMMIPCANIVLMFVWAFGHGNVNRKNWCRASLAIMGVLLGIYILVAIFAVVVGISAFRY
ncbi:hypothetical protein [Hespellia stercorisuis]|uniref:Uncharacterized protein n=1 Tax=Hespellia stercorisuis DSM 15480 TaxID=1121950 RepID=A0A1M6HHI7_9FIRM|nr:hypothetical protein [Hespellia stercorisuis]SHJ21633.1 hypothetical protein SAMN02745243_00022 [Hespellia stercorisuis DSM 15480]